LTIFILFQFTGNLTNSTEQKMCNV